MSNIDSEYLSQSNDSNLSRPANPTNPSNLLRARSARRLRHEAQAKVFEKETGSLEDIRSSLGLRPSQICEILKVHPSAWTRWVRTGRVPPHVFQMLEWYVELLRWRGQNSPLPPKVLKPKVQEDLEVYVPSGDRDRDRERVGVSYRAQMAVKPRWFFLLWASQILLWAAFFVILRVKILPH